MSTGHILYNQRLYTPDLPFGSRKFHQVPTLTLDLPYESFRALLQGTQPVSIACTVELPYENLRAPLQGLYPATTPCTVDLPWDPDSFLVAHLADPLVGLYRLLQRVLACSHPL
jgi:hypothetical protein